MRLREDQKEQVVRDYHAGDSCPVIAARLGMNHTSIWAFLKGRGVQLRSRSDAKRTKTLNQAAFAEPLSEDAAYWVGFLMADGNVSPRGNSAYIKLGLAARDGHHVEAFRLFLGSNHKIDRRVISRGFSKRKTSEIHSLCISSAKIASDLATYGVVPKKSLTAKPADSIAMNPAFWRGMIDGDGHVSLFRDSHGYPKPVVGLTGSLGCVTAFREFVLRYHPSHSATHHKQDNIYHHRVYSRGAVEVLKILYPSGAFALTRKYDLAHKIISDAQCRDLAKVPPKCCSVSECDLPIEGLGFCRKHYKRFRKHGDVSAIGSRWQGVAKDGTAQAEVKPMRKRRCDAKEDGFMAPQ